MRLIAADTETTGLYSKAGDRIIEIALVEITRSAQPRTFHSYFTPQGREISPEAFNVHGLSAEFLADKPTFAERFDEICEFIDGATLIIHNAPFDIGFLRDECLEANLVWPEPPVIDTLKLASRERPGQRNSLDALCLWQGIDLSVREKHSAIVDTQLLAELYLRWKGQSSLDLSAIQGQQTGIAAAMPHAMNPALIPAPMPAAAPAPAWESLLRGLNL